MNDEVMMRNYEVMRMRGIMRDEVMRMRNWEI